MTMRRVSFATGALLLCSVFAIAQDDADLQKWMKTTGAEFGSLRKMESKTGPDVAASAEKIAVIYDQMKGYWEKKHVDDAVKLSADGKTAAMDLASAAKAGDAEKANAALKAMGGTCQGCHNAHREKAADGSYKIK